MDFVFNATFSKLSFISYNFRVELDCSKTGARGTLVNLLQSYHAVLGIALYCFNEKLKTTTTVTEKINLTFYLIKSVPVTFKLFLLIRVLKRQN